MPEPTERDRELADAALARISWGAPERSCRAELLRVAAQAREEGRQEMRSKGEWRDGYLAGSRRAIVGMQDLISELEEAAVAFLPKKKVQDG